MSQNPSNRRNNGNQNEGWTSTDTAAAAGLATVATLAGGALYWMLSGSKKPEAPLAQPRITPAQFQSSPSPVKPSGGGSGSFNLTNLWNSLSSSSRYYRQNFFIESLEVWELKPVEHDHNFFNLKKALPYLHINYS